MHGEMEGNDNENAWEETGQNKANQVTLTWLRQHVVMVLPADAAQDEMIYMLQGETCFISLDLFYVLPAAKGMCT